MNKNAQSIKYIVSDVISSIFAWSLFFVFRKISIDVGEFKDINLVFVDTNLYKGLVFIPLFWVFLYFCQGTYTDPYRKSRLKELSQTFFISIFGVIILFFAFLLDDQIQSYKNYYFSFFILFITHFSLTYIPRLVITTIAARKIHKKIIGFPTIIIGNNPTALKLYNDIENQEISSGNKIIGYVNYGNTQNGLSEFLPSMGDYKDIDRIIQNNKVEEIIIALDTQYEDDLHSIITDIETNNNVLIKISAQTKDILLGRVKISSIFQTPLVLVSNEVLDNWQKVIKRLMDIVFSILAMIILAPVYLITAIIIKCTSKGPIFYSQERIGYRGKAFNMHKFRSMYVNAEKDGLPMLSSDSDSRITPFGKFMRKVRLDEIPQFYNVLIGTMSLVGPRPERQYFIDQIVKRAPEYMLLRKVKPGITSWGQVKFGYAENVDEMVERLKYDLLYIENLSVATDIKILLYTFIIIAQGRGK
ncbi:MAG: sugar transferase [Bacteroidales bacterium]|jgi:exopolysaccharide biosynthesis polyprenyl glycosylphosphotransferase|nr:sugar transferase [Bacteroidales bacterium]